MTRRGDTGGRRVAAAVVAAFALALAPTAGAAPGDLDEGFGGGGSVIGAPGVANSTATGVARDAQGRLVVVGVGTEPAGGFRRAFVGRFTAGGAPDATFNAAGPQAGMRLIAFGAEQIGAAAVTLASDDDILVAWNGEFGTVGVTRLNENGAPDAQFSDDGEAIAFPPDVNQPYSAADLALDSQGRILIAATHRAGTSQARAVITRLTAAGAVDHSFSGGAGDTTPGVDLTPAGMPSRLAAVEALPGDAVLVAGGCRSGAADAGLVARYDDDGQLDPTFNPNGPSPGVHCSAHGATTAAFQALTLAGDGIYAGGRAGDPDGIGRGLVVRLTNAGVPDPAFAAAGGSPGAARIELPDPGAGPRAVLATGLAVEPGGRVVAGLTHGFANGTRARIALARLTQTGVLDPTFGSGSARPGTVEQEFASQQSQSRGLALQPDGKAVLAGGGQYAEQRLLLARFEGGDAAAPGPDADGDGVDDAADNCVAQPNPGQQDADGDGEGDACDADDDDDGDPDGQDNCPFDHNPGQLDTDGDGDGNPCEPDDDNDGDADGQDNCPVNANPGQRDTDGDGDGDACDPDNDNDGDVDAQDNCPLVHNPGQRDTDADADGDACDTDDDNDGDPDGQDNCPVNANPAQQDADGDGSGDACDPTPGNGGGGGGDGGGGNPPPPPEPQPSAPAGPTAEFSWSPGPEPCVGKVTFDASASVAGDTPIVSYRWEIFLPGTFGSQPIGLPLARGTTTTPIFSHVFTYDWDYDEETFTDRAVADPAVVYLVVTDEAGRQSGKSQTIRFTNADVPFERGPGGGLVPGKGSDPCPGRSLSVLAPLPIVGGTTTAPVQGGALQLTERCPPGDRGCGASLFGTLVLGGGRASAGAAQGRRRTREPRVTKKLEFALPPGTTAKIKLKLNKRGRKLMRGGRLRRIRLTYTPLALQGKPKSKTRVVRVRAR